MKWTGHVVLSVIPSKLVFHTSFINMVKDRILIFGSGYHRYRSLLLTEFYLNYDHKFFPRFFFSLVIERKLIFGSVFLSWLHTGHASSSFLLVEKMSTV